MTTGTEPRPAGVGVEEPETTKVERFLAFILAVFLLIGLLWCYAQPLDRTDNGYLDGRILQSDPAVRARDDALVAVDQATSRLEQARVQEETTRETYRTKLDAGQPATAEEALYRAAQAERTRTEGLAEVARKRLVQVQPAGDAAQARLERDFESGRNDREQQTFLLRLAAVVAALAASYGLLEFLRRRRSRYLPTGMAAIGASAGMAVVMTGDYLDVQRTGPIVLSLVGITLTVTALVAYQRYLAHRLPARRVRKGECPYCGYPNRAGTHCEGCGRPAVAACTTCAQPRRVGARYCTSCGAP